MGAKKKLALVIGQVPTVDEIDQFRLLASDFEINVVCSESICGYLTQTSYFQDLTCVALPDHDDNPTFLPGLEKVLSDYDVVIVKERLGLYAYQTVKAKWQHRFRLIVWVDNLTAFAANDVDQMRTVRMEVTKAADAFIVQSKAARETLLLEGVEGARILEMTPWVEKRVKRNKKNRAEALKALGLPESSLLICHFGQIEWEEGLADLATAIKLAGSQSASLKRRLRVVFCGVGSYGPELRNQFVNLGIDDIVVYTAPNRRTIDTIMTAADAMFISSIPARDRIDGDPYRLVSAMTNEIPVLASRSAIVEEYCGKHRLDFCQSSPLSLAQTLAKLEDANALVQDLIKKNADEVKKKYSQEKAKASMQKAMDAAGKLEPVVDELGLDQRLQEIESRIKNKQYLDAVDMIENVFKFPEVPVHHKANLYRMVGDCFAKLGDADGAKDAYLQAGELDPYLAKVWIGLGTVSLIKNSFDLAVLHFQKAISLSPEDDMANLGLGLAFQGMKENKEAMRWVAKALDLNAENTAAIFTLVQLVHATEQFSIAEKYLRRYLQLHSHDTNLKFTLGGILFKMGRAEEVVALMEEILKTDAANERAHTLLKQAKEGQERAEASSNKR